MANSLKKTFADAPTFRSFFPKSDGPASLHVQARGVDASRCGGTSSRRPGCDSASRFVSAGVARRARLRLARRVRSLRRFGVAGPGPFERCSRLDRGVRRRVSAARDTPARWRASPPDFPRFPFRNDAFVFRRDRFSLRSARSRSAAAASARTYEPFTRRFAGAGAAPARARDDGLAALRSAPSILRVPPRVEERGRAQQGRMVRGAAPDRGTRAGFVRGVGFVRARARCAGGAAKGRSAPREPAHAAAQRAAADGAR